MTFNIGSQDGGVINNVAGNQYITGGQQGSQVSHRDAASAAATVRELIAATELGGLSEADRQAVTEEAAAIHKELSGQEPSAQAVKPRLERLTSLLSAAGAFAGAGTALLGPLTTLAQWLGPLGASALTMLPVG